MSSMAETTARPRRPRVEPRLLRLVDAAHYCGISPQTFLRECPVAPVDLGDRMKRWDRVKLDRWIDDLSGDAPDTQTDEEWLAGLNSNASHRQAGRGQKKRPQDG